MPTKRKYESFGEQFLHLFDKEFEATWLLLAIPIISILLTLCIWFIKSMINKKNKKAKMKQRMEKGRIIEAGADTKAEQSIENVLDQLAVSHFVATPAVSFSEARRSSFIPGLY